MFRNLKEVFQAAKIKYLSSRGGFQTRPCNIGEVPEWLNGAVSKTVVPKGTEGSNPSLSARKTIIGNQQSAVSCRGGFETRPCLKL